MALSSSLSLASTNVVMNYSEIESKVREATNDDPWGPSGQLMGEIAKWVFRSEGFPWYNEEMVYFQSISCHKSIYISLLPPLSYVSNGP